MLNAKHAYAAAMCNAYAAHNDKAHAQHAIERTQREAVFDKPLGNRNAALFLARLGNAEALRQMQCAIVFDAMQRASAALKA